MRGVCFQGWRKSGIEKRRYWNQKGPVKRWRERSIQACAAGLWHCKGRSKAVAAISTSERVFAITEDQMAARFFACSS